MKYSRVYIELTNICNKSCSFCPKTKREPGRLSKEQFELITDKLMGVTEYLYLHLMGEPLVHPELADFIKIATAKGYKCAVTTNGTLLPRFGDALIDAGVYKVNISVHSFEDGTKGEAEEYLRECMEFADKASASGVLTVLRLWNRGHDNGRNLDTEAALRAFFSDGEWVLGDRGARIRHKLHLEYGERFDWPDMEREPLGDEVFCYGLADHFGILCDGSVVPCCLDKDADITLGNVFDSDIQDILFGERAVKIREGFRAKRACEELCRRCGYARRFKL